jgi:teichuronic acid biosynthesis glycosyltransferase TuaH
MKLKRPILVLSANTPWVYALAHALSDFTSVTALRLLDLPNYRRLRPKWPETTSALNRVSIVMPPGYAGALEPLFRPLMRASIWYQQRRLRKLSGLDPLVIVPYPFLAPWVRHVPGDLLVYYNLDEYPLYAPWRTERILEEECELVARAGLTICLSLHQVETLKARNPESVDKIRHFPLGVVEDFLNPEPKLRPLPNSVGYVGNLSDRVDWDFVVAVATLMPDAKFHFVGPLDPGQDTLGWRASQKRAFAMPNVLYQGEVPQAAVREHYWRYATNWMPYDTSHSFNRASCPTKILDALASGRPFISTDIPEVRQYADRVACVKSAADAAAILSRFLRGEESVDPESQIDFVRTQTWAQRAAEFRRMLGEHS